MVVFAFSLQDQVEKYGAYVGIASFFGLALLSLLYFAQAREVKRLREWAGRAPERAAEVEAMAVAHAEEALRAAEEEQPAPAPAPAPVPAAANGAVELKPAEVAALAFARAAGVHTPHPPRPHPVPAAALAASPPEMAAAGAALAAGEPGAARDVAVAAGAGDAAAAQDAAPAETGDGPPTAYAPGAGPPATAAPIPAGDAAPAAEAPATTNGHGTGEVPPPPPATPAARRAEPPPQRLEPLPSPRRHLPPPRRAATPPPREGTSTRAVVLTAVLGILILGGIAFGLTRLLGGDDNQPAKPPTVASTTPEPPAQGTGTPESTAAPTLTKDTIKVAVYNGTVQPGLAGSIKDQLVHQGYPEGNVGADTYTPDQQREASVAMYRRGARAAAQAVAKDLGIASIQLIDSATQQLIDQSGNKWDVVVIVGADKSQ
jgi:hypothetical protein